MKGMHSTGIQIRDLLPVIYANLSFDRGYVVFFALTDINVIHKIR